MNAGLTAPPPRAARPAVRAVLFDLDGTLLDTVLDIAAALNAALQEQQLTPLAAAEVRLLIGRGVPTLIERALARLGAAAARADRALLQQSYHAYYQHLHQRNAFKARPFPGVAQGLRGLHALGLHLAVVTNKSQDLAVDLLARLELGQWIDAVVGAQGDRQRKPDPQPLLLACERLQVRPAQALMVGDSLVDVSAARAAGIAIVCVPYGYNEGADPRTLPCDSLVESIAELPAFLAGTSRPGAPLRSA
jgi:phosphoglycolate phosphatase